MVRNLRNNRLLSNTTFVVAMFAIAGASAAKTISVGPGKQFAAPCAALTSAVNGDVIEIEASGAYVGDSCAFGASNLTIRGVNGRPKIIANGSYARGKGTWVPYGNNTTIDNIEMSGAAVPDQNGAAIRLDGQHLTLRNSYLHHNENGILTNNDGISNVIVENSEFGFNGFGTGYTHNLYIGHINSLVFRGNYSHDANAGHDLKSRAETNTILYNRFSSTTGRPSYEIDLPNAGTAYVIGNVIHQPAVNQNPGLMTFGVEGATNTKQDLYVVNNTFLNDDSSRGTFIFVGSAVTTPVLMQNNIFVGTGTTITQVNAIDKSNYRTLTPSFVDRANFDLHPTPGSPVIDAGTTAGASASGLSLLANAQYKHATGLEARPVNGPIDIGAYEARVVGPAPALTPAPTPMLTSVPKLTPAPVVTQTPLRTLAPAPTPAPTVTSEPLLKLDELDD